MTNLTYSFLRFFNNKLKKLNCLLLLFDKNMQFLEN